MSFKCDKCDKEFSSKQLLNRHEKRKTPCSHSGLSCPECGDTFSNRVQLHDHITDTHNVFDASGSSPPSVSGIMSYNSFSRPPLANSQKNTEATDAKSRETLLREVRQIRQLVRDADIDEPDQSVVERSNVRPREHADTRDVVADGQTPSVADPDAPKALRQFGRESQDFIERLEFEELKKVLKLTLTLDTVFAMVKLVQFNSKHPENRNVKIDHADDERVKVFRRGQWRTEDMRDTILNMIGRNRLRFYDVEHLLSRNMRKKSLQTLDQFLDDVEDIANKNKEPDEDYESLIEDIREEVYRASLTESD